MTSTTAPVTDTLGAILGSSYTARIADLRATQPEKIEELEAYYTSVFAPTDLSAAQLSIRDRALVAARVADFTHSTAVVAWYQDLALANGATQELVDAVLAGTPTGSAATDAALRHADLLTAAPATATASNLEALKQAGLTPGAIVALSQTIAFVSYQLRLIALFRALGELA